MERTPPPRCEHDNVAATCLIGPCNGFMTVEKAALLSDEEAVRLAGANGPAVIGKALFDRAQHVNTVNPGGTLGPLVFADETELRRTGKIPLDKHGRRLASSKPSQAQPSSSSATAPSFLAPQAFDESIEPPALTQEEIDAELKRRVEAKKARGQKMAPPVTEDEAPVPALAQLADNAEFDRLSAILDNPKASAEARSEAEERLAELTAPRFD